MKTLIGIGRALAAVLAMSSPALPVQGATKAEQAQTAAKIVQQTLQKEAREGLPDRIELLAPALEQAPDYGPARWHSGFVYDAKRKQWLRPWGVADAAAEDKTLAVYRQKREKSAKTLEAQVELARWCSKHKLDDQARVHWINVLQMQPGNEEAVRELVRIVNASRPKKAETAEAKAVARKTGAVMAKQISRLEKLRSGAFGDSEGQREKARQELLTIRDPDAVEAIDTVFCRQGGELALLGIEILKRIQAPQAAAVLAWYAAFSPSPPVRQAAATALRSQEKYDYVPLLLYSMQTPIETGPQPENSSPAPGLGVGVAWVPHITTNEGSFGSYFNNCWAPWNNRPNHSVANWYFGNAYGESPWGPPGAAPLAPSIPTNLNPSQVYRLTPGRGLVNGRGIPWAGGPKNAIVYESYGPSLWEYSVWSTVPGWTYTQGPTTTTFYDVGSGYGTYDGRVNAKWTSGKFRQTTTSVTPTLVVGPSSAQPATAQPSPQQTAISQYNAAVTSRNSAVCSALGKATGDARPASPSEWRAWWYDVNEVYTPLSQGTFRPAQRASAAREDTPAQAGDCLAAGTLVRAETGLTPIEKLTVGDRVFACDSQTGCLALKPVLEKTSRAAGRLLKIRAGGEEIQASGGHIFWVAGKGWVKARDLRAGMPLHTIRGTVPVESTEIGTVEKSFSLVAADFDTFFVGKAMVLTHDNTIRRPTTCTVPGLVVAK